VRPLVDRCGGVLKMARAVREMARSWRRLIPARGRSSGSGGGNESRWRVAGDHCSSQLQSVTGQTCLPASYGHLEAEAEAANVGLVTANAARKLHVD
jgi:hypothetical protein